MVYKAWLWMSSSHVLVQFIYFYSFLLNSDVVYELHYRMCKHIMRSKVSAPRPEDSMESDHGNKQDDMRADWCALTTCFVAPRNQTINNQIKMLLLWCGFCTDQLSRQRSILSRNHEISPFFQWNTMPFIIVKAKKQILPAATMTLLSAVLLLPWLLSLFWQCPMLL